MNKQWSQGRPLHHQSFSKSGWGWFRIRPDVEGLGQRTRVSDFMLFAFFFFFSASTLRKGILSLVAQMVKNLPAMQETQVCSLGQKDLLGKGMSIHSSILVWRISWPEEPGGYSTWDHKELDTTEQVKIIIIIVIFSCL